MLAVINSDKPFFPGNLETLMQNFDTCERVCLICESHHDMSRGCSQEHGRFIVVSNVCQDVRPISTRIVSHLSAA
jgi:hypothetical protein